jgi:hypothetical protein
VLWAKGLVRYLISLIGNSHDIPLRRNRKKRPKKGGVNTSQRIISNKNGPLNPYVIDFFQPVDLPSVELEERVGRKDMIS